MHDSERIVGYPEVIFEPDLAYAVGWKDGSNVGDIVGTRKGCLGMDPGAAN